MINSDWLGAWEPLDCSFYFIKVITQLWMNVHAHTHKHIVKSNAQLTLQMCAHCTTHIVSVFMQGRFTPPNCRVILNLTHPAVKRRLPVEHGWPVLGHWEHRVGLAEWWVKRQEAALRFPRVYNKVNLVAYGHRTTLALFFFSLEEFDLAIYQHIGLNHCTSFCPCTFDAFPTPCAF